MSDDGAPHEPARPEDTPARTAPTGGLGKVLDAEDFSLADAVGGWRGFAEAAAPGVVFVAAYLIDGTMRVPVIAAVATMVVLVIVRLIQRSSIQQALSGAVGVGIGAIWAWRTGEPSDYFAGGLLLNAAYLVGLIISMVVRWPVVGIVAGLLRGEGTGWRQVPREMKAMQIATALLAAMFALRLAVQAPLYFADQVAALGTARLVMGVPLFALTLWAVWLVVQSARPASETPDPPQPTQ
ncbi:DUF3159 domain-containing protein [Demequina sp. NBRC 110055]|uniref:DUF3159 domain-containing protein n=1 Tax=Demequina sp. NBRC 110055 TaxID=1570344 RepID=UPI000A052B2D|nr:DUF3159 domain-containing protein [Demequina sp. NBRC 110055]